MLNHPTTGSSRTASALALSPEDVRGLLEDSSAQVRVDITQKIAGAYGQVLLHERELKVAEQIFRLLLRDTELRVRCALAQHIKESKIIPRDIVMVMARDVEEVALPILEYSEVLTPQDLVELVEMTRNVSRHLAISRRRHVPSEVTGALLRANNDEVTQSLVHNQGAEFSEEELAQVIEQHAEDQAMMEALGTRSRLPLTAVEKLLTVVSESLAEQLKAKYHVVPEAEAAITNEAVSTRETETLELVKDMNNDEELQHLVTQMHESGRLSSTVILGALCQGNFSFFEASLACLAGIPIANAQTLLNDQGDLGFRGLYNKSGLPEKMLPAVRLLFKVVREVADAGEKPGKTRYANRVVERILHYSETDPIENLSYIIALVRRST